ncbi:MAG: flagellar biosynthetic protein FliO [Erythrobacter sp.]
MGIGTIFSSLLAIVLALAFVLGLAWGVIWILRKVQESGMGKDEAAGEGRSLRFVRALPLGPRERLVLIETGGEQLLLGVTGGMISIVAHWDESGRAIAAMPAKAHPPQRQSPELVAALRAQTGGL